MTQVYLPSGARSHMYPESGISVLAITPSPRCTAPFDTVFANALGQHGQVISDQSELIYTKVYRSDKFLARVGSLGELPKQDYQSVTKEF